MARRRRQISKDGYLLCRRGNHVVHIRDFYQTGNSVWFLLEDPKTGVTEVFGKPMSWCKECTNEYQRARRESTEVKAGPEVVDKVEPEIPWWETDEALETLKQS